MIIELNKPKFLSIDKKLQMVFFPIFLQDLLLEFLLFFSFPSPNQAKLHALKARC